MVWWKMLYRARQIFRFCNTSGDKGLSIVIGDDVCITICIKQVLYIYMLKSLNLIYVFKETFYVYIKKKKKYDIYF